MSHSHPAGLLAAYNSLTDKHLAGYFNNTRIRRHLLRSGLITRSGRILSEKEYKLNIMKRDHQKYIRECLAQAIFHKVLDMERYHQLEIKKKLESLARKERIQRFKGEHTRWSVENNMPVLSPHPPVGPKTNRGHSVLVDEGHSSPLTLTAPRPYTAPGTTQPPVRLQPLPSNPAVGTVPKVTPGSRPKTSLLENEAPFPTGGKKAMMRLRNSMDNSRGVNSYLLPNIKSYLMPIPPPSPPPSRKNTRENRPETWRRRRFRPTTAPNGSDPLCTRDSKKIHKTPLHSNAAITMIYLGKNVHLSYDFRDEIKVYQQHCGGENLCVYKGKLLEKETFQFISKRHHGFPFSLTFFLNGIQVNRLSSCCEYKHRKGSRLGGKRGYFGFVCVERSSPCYKCIIAMGLDKKPTKPRKDKSIERREELKKSDGKLRKDREYLIPRRNDIERNKISALSLFSAQEETTGIKEVRTAVEELERKVKSVQDAWEYDQDNIFKYEYEEDFEVDEEKQDEKANEEGQAYDQMSGMSKSPSDDESDNLDLEKESETSSQKAPDVDDNVKDEGDGYSVSESEEDKQDTKSASSTSSRSHLCSSSSEDGPARCSRKDHAENRPNKSARSSSSQELSENAGPRKFHLLIEDSLGIETEDQEIVNANMRTNSLSVKEGLENVLKEETKKVTQMIAEDISEKSRKRVSKEEKEKDKSKLWDRSDTKVKDKKAGACRVEKGVGQIIAGALEAGCHCRHDAESGAGGAHDREKLQRKREIDTGAAPDSNSVVQKREELNSIKGPKQVTPEMYTVGEKEVAEEGEGPQQRHAETTEEQGDAALCGGVGANEAPLGEWKPRAAQASLAEQSTEERERPQVVASGAGAETEGGGRLGTEVFHPKGQEAARDQAGMNEDEVPQEQNSMQTGLEREMAVSEEERDLEKAVLACSVAMKSEHIQEAVALRDTVEVGEAEMGATMSEVVSEKPDEDDSEEDAFTDLEDKGLMGETVPEREGGLGGATVGGEEPTKERKEIMEMKTPLSSSTSEVMETLGGLSGDSFQKLCKEDVGREKVETEPEFNKEDGRKEMLPEEFDATREEKKAERPKTILAVTEPKREEVTGANECQDEDTLEEEQKFKGEEGQTVKEVRPEEETQALANEVECDAEQEAPIGASELTEGTESQEVLLAETGVTAFEVVPGFEKSVENITAPRKEGDTEHTSKAELLPRETGASEEEEGSVLQGEGVLRAPESELTEKPRAFEERLIATAEVQESSARDQDGHAGQEGKDKEEPLQEPHIGRVMATTQEAVSEGDTPMAGMLSEEATVKDPEEEVGRECTPEIEVVMDGDTERHGSFPGGAVVAQEDLHQRGGAEVEIAAEKREVLADSRTAEGKTDANKASSFSDVAGEETWHKVDELLGKTAAAQKVVVQELVLREEVTVTTAPDTKVECLPAPSELAGKSPQLGQGQEGGETETILRAESRVEEAETESQAGGQESAVEELRLGLPQGRESEPSRESLQDMETLPAKPNCTATREKQELTVQKESENTDVPLKNTKA
ncbi:PREDICTED: glutamate-rich protein 3 [Condylura cristata]|uniref:glutamate-rich protein 3 n=1 Tax=Condylura cristata TaxID=143302 RepID=UPI0006433240|nr:PREDICTED: glutamate-rich protein 3 [Condylura cristata]